MRTQLHCKRTAALLAIAALPGCGNPDPTAGKPREAAPVPVRMAQAIQQDVPTVVRAIGWVEPFQTVTVKPQIEGQLEKIHFDQGQDVKEGDQLFTIDPRPLQSAVTEAEAALARDKALSVDAAREVIRLTELGRQNITTDREIEAARADAESRLAQTRVDEASLVSAKLRLEYTQIKAPISGVVGARMVDKGNILKANEGGLVIINQITPVYVRFSVAEQQLSRIRAQMQKGDLAVQAKPAGDDGPPEIGRLDFIDNQVDPATGMIRMKAVYPNEHRRLWPGRYAEVSLIVSTLKDAVLVPSQAIQDSQSGASVLVVRSNHTVDLRRVTTGPIVDSHIVITSGVSAGETVITDGQLRVAPGAKVVEATTSAPAPTGTPSAGGSPTSSGTTAEAAASVSTVKPTSRDATP